MIGVQTGLQALGQDGVRGDVRRVPQRERPTRSGWARSAGPTCVCAARTPACRSARTARRRWPIEDLALFRALGRLDRAVPRRRHERRRARRARWRGSRASPTSARPGRRRPRCTAPTRRSRSAGRRRSPSTDHDDVTLVGAGITLHECLAAHDMLGRRRHHRPRARLLQRQADRRGHAALARSTTPGTIVVVEDHRVEGGLGDAVLDALAATGPLPGACAKLGVTQMPGSATPEQLRAWAGIDAAAIADRGPRGGRPVRRHAARGRRDPAERVGDDLLGRHRLGEVDTPGRAGSRVSRRNASSSARLDTLGERR